MGARPASQEFHECLRQSIVGVEGVIEIEDVLLVHGKTQEQYEADKSYTTERNAFGVHLRSFGSDTNLER